MGNIDKIFLHIGCGDRRIEGFINSDKNPVSNLDKKMDIRYTWPYRDNTVDGIVGISVFQCLTWRELIFAFRESYRVLKKGGVMRIGVPLIENGKPVDYLLGWNNINLFSYELLDKVLIKHIGYLECRLCNYCETSITELAQGDNRPEQIFYIEVRK
jgi:predicted SAM-dependent methyltransferase